MNLSNIWQHPKTTLYGILAAVVTICGVLIQQGVTGAQVGTGTVVTLIGALASAMLGMLAKDPGSQSAPATSTNSTQKLGAILLVALLLPLACVPTVGCTASQVQTVVTEIDAYLPTAIALAQDALQIWAAMDKSSTVAATSRTIQSDLVELKKMADDYLAASSGSAKTTAWGQIQALSDTIVQDADGLLASAEVKNPNSQATAVVILTSLDAAVHIIDGYVSTAQTPAQVKAKLAKRTVKLTVAARYWTERERSDVAAAYGVRMSYQQAQAAGF